MFRKKSAGHLKQVRHRFLKSCYRPAPGKHRLFNMGINRFIPKPHSAFQIGKTADHHPITRPFVTKVQAVNIIQTLADLGTDQLQLIDKIEEIPHVVDPVKVVVIFYHQAGRTVVLGVNQED
jgi:hypothetical protein